MFDKLKIALVLVVIGAVSGIAIYSVNIMTKDTIAQNMLEREQGYYKALFFLDDDEEISFETIDIDGSLDSEIVLYDDSLNVIGYIYKGTDKNNYGDVVVLVGVTPEGVVSNVVISSTTNTPTFTKIIKNVYLSNFQSQAVDEIHIDDSTGATYTYSSVVKVLNNAADYFIVNRGGQDD